MDGQISYCGQPVTRCAKIIAWIGAIFALFAMLGNAYIKPEIAISAGISFAFFMLTLLGLRKEHPTWILISSIIMLIHALINAISVILLIYAAIVLPEYIVKPFKTEKVTEKEAKEMARIICFIFAFLSFLVACFNAFAYKVFSNARKYYLQRGSYISPSILERV
uniref:Uncharacterized protein n=1 Tax=Panagrolaimus sp. PS1159 TaxID=55785 RepID=A0AC35EVD1_9BILA